MSVHNNAPGTNFRHPLELPAGAAADTNCPSAFCTALFPSLHPPHPPSFIPAARTPFCIPTPFTAQPHHDAPPYTAIMADPAMDDEDLFADLYDGDDTTNEAPGAPTKTAPDPQAAADAAADDFLTQQAAEPAVESHQGNGANAQQEQQSSYDQNMSNQQTEFRDPTPDNRPLIGTKEDG
ncbi:hypothetical protein CERZMDRAFT_83602 [Cercospora zeae-maydis SCOH1-5]|uniref:Uncharacterized protein n=1 Tax=Cercospora zeae-maydis SCOH1-5 TaxID=717836 RepID=A0A6A6FJ11_9PEZI|nr:hypothetical protein CERZMDRAFT_83602 [Cercospora zeae-maydis SCOH1-5]